MNSIQYKILWVFMEILSFTDSKFSANPICNSYTMATRDLLVRVALGLGHIYQASPKWPWYK